MEAVRYYLVSLDVIRCNKSLFNYTTLPVRSTVEWFKEKKIYTTLEYNYLRELVVRAKKFVATNTSSCRRHDPVPASSLALVATCCSDTIRSVSTKHASLEIWRCQTHKEDKNWMEAKKKQRKNRSEVKCVFPLGTNRSCHRRSTHRKKTRKRANSSHNTALRVVSQFLIPL